MEDTVHKDAVAPYKYVYEATSGDFDLSTVTGGSLSVLKPPDPSTGEREAVVWAAIVAVSPPQSETFVRLEHEFEAGDLDLAGEYVVEPVLTVPGGTLRAEPRAFVVREEFG